MQNALKNLEKFGIEKTDLFREYHNALLNPSFSELVKNIKLDEKILMTYTSIIEECASEYDHCKNCKGILECPNRIKGHAYLPVMVNGNLNFNYKPCKYQEKIIKNNRFQKNIRFFNTPESLKSASMDKIFKTDKNRFEAILWINEFIAAYKKDNHQKGLYLHGNFGCGKTYMIAALFNELASLDYKSSIIFWPEFLRQAFYDDFKEKYEYVKKVPLLLIDDIGAENLTAWNRDEILCPLLQYRMDEGLTTFFTSNLSLTDLEEHLSNSKSGVELVKSGRIISRIKQLTCPLEMVSKNLRK